jgi:hypothetical protein
LSLCLHLSFTSVFKISYKYNHFQNKKQQLHHGSEKITFCTHITTSHQPTTMSRSTLPSRLDKIYGLEAKPGAAKRYTLEYLMETGIPVTVEEMAEVVRADQARLKAAGYPEADDTFSLESYYYQHVRGVAAGAIIQLGPNLFRFNPRNLDNRASVEDAYKEGRLPLKL